MDAIELIKNDTDNSYLPKLLENDYYPMVSVVTPTFNRDYLFDIAIFNWNNFIYPKNKIEWIILDDSSRDSIKKLKKKLPKDSRIKYYTCKKIDTISKKRNKVNELASGDIIVHVDDDDYYPPDSIINRVRSLLTYSKKCVGSSSVNCINLLDNTCFKTGGGYSDNTIITAEASLCYYKKFWQEQGYDENIKSEECKAFLKDRTNDYIDLHSAFVMIAITHSKNMSDRVLKNSINRFNFFSELPVMVVNLLETLQLRIHESLEGMSEAKDFVRQNYGKSYGEILPKLERLPDYVKSTSLMSSYIEDIHPTENISDNSVIATYFPGTYYRTIKYVCKNQLDYKMLQIINYLKEYYLNKNIRLYVWTHGKFCIDNIDIIPWYYFNKKVASEFTVIFDEYSHLDTIQNSKSITYVNLSNENIVHSGDFFKKINKYDTFGNKNYIFKTGNITSPLPINNLKYYYLGLGNELNNNKIFTEIFYNKLFKNYEEIHSYSFNRFDKDYSVLTDNDMNCEFFVLSTVNIPLMCYLLKLGIKYIRIDEEDLNDFGVLSIYDDLPSDYLRLLDEKLKTVIKIM
jgi:glycosyltransferase involved in cell wall biosynthesis